MTQFYNLPTTVLGSAGVSIDLGVGGVGGPEATIGRDKDVYLTFIESAGVAFTAQVLDANNSYDAPVTVEAFGTFQLKKVPNVRFVTFKGSGATLTGKIASYEVNPAAIVVTPPSGTQNVNISQVAGTPVAGPELPTQDVGLDGLIYATGSPPSAQLAVGVIDPPQFTNSGGKKVVPVHDLGA